jgi:hypothetical protein
MNCAELEEILRQRKVDPSAYSLGGGLPAEKYTLDHAGSKWSVYYSERGQKNDERIFDFEDEACRYLLNLLSSDLSTGLD